MFCIYGNTSSRHPEPWNSRVTVFITVGTLLLPKTRSKFKLFISALWGSPGSGKGTHHTKKHHRISLNSNWRRCYCVFSCSGYHQDPENVPRADITLYSINSNLNFARVFWWQHGVYIKDGQILLFHGSDVTTRPSVHEEFACQY